MIRASTLLTISILLIGSISAAQSPPNYSVRLIADTHSPTDINEAGLVVGTDPLNPAAERAWIAAANKPLSYLPLPAGRVSSRANDVNELGVVVGTVSSVAYADPSFGAIAAIWTPNSQGTYTVQELGKLSGHVGSEANALNDLGDIVGYSFDGTFKKAVWFNSPSGILDLTPTGAFDPQAINNQRKVVCYYQHCSRLDLNTMVLEDLGVPQGSYTNTLGNSINEANQVAGVAILATGSNCNRQAARYTDGIGWEVFGPCGQNNGSGNMNQLGDLTRWQNVAAHLELEGVGSFATESLIVAPVGQWFMGVLATGLINSAREIAVFAQNPTTGQAGVVLLQPITYVGTGLCAGDGLNGGCPCNNESGVGEYDGCRNSSGLGARLLATGSDSIANDDLVLSVSQAPANQTVLFFQGGIGNGVPFFDGLRCASNPLVRLQLMSLNAAGEAQTSVSIATKGGVQSGQSRTYQAWFRDPMGPCGSAANVSAAVQITWL